MARVKLIKVVIINDIQNIRNNTTGDYGTKDKVYKSKAKAERQGRAIKASQNRKGGNAI